MTVAVVIAVYSNFPDLLLKSIDSQDVSTKIYLYFHGTDPVVRDRVNSLANSDSRITAFPYGINRGLARTWNEAIHLSRQAGYEFCLIANDDLHFREDGYVKFVEFVRNINEPYGLATVRGLELEDSPHSGHILPQDFACCVISDDAIDKIGYLDTTFSPAYFEDMDYKRRLMLAGLPIVVDQRVLVEHQRSLTMRTSIETRILTEKNYDINHNYYSQKWGGTLGEETFTAPFDDPAFPHRLGFEEALLTDIIRKRV